GARGAGVARKAAGAADRGAASGHRRRRVADRMPEYPRPDRHDRARREDGRLQSRHEDSPPLTHAMTRIERLGAGLFLAALFATSARAETATFGIEAGAAASSLGPAADGQSIQTGAGVALGLYAVFPILKSVSFVPELL